MQKTKIQWCDSTINGSSGCDGCELWSGSNRTCYAGLMHETRLAKSLPALYAENFSEVRMIPGRFRQAANWSDLTGKERSEPGNAKPWLNGRPRHIFVGDMGDTFSKAVTAEYLKRELFGAIESKNGSRHVWLLLTKQIARLADLSEELGGLPDNVVAMTTVTNPRTADVRLPHLLRVKCRTRGISAEPLLGALNIRDYLIPVFGNAAADAHCANIHWVIAGGESGPDARPMHREWAESLRDQCSIADVPFFFKQWGHWSPYAPLRDQCYDFKDGRMLANDGTCYRPADIAYPNGPRCGEAIRANHHQAGLMMVYPVGKEAAGRELNGHEHNGMPTLSILQPAS